MKKIIFCVILFFLYQVKAEDSLPIKIAKTGSDKDLSVGWNQITVRTDLGDLVKLSSNPDTGVIECLSVTGKNNIKFSADELVNVRFPDFRTLKNVWYDNSLSRISMLRFEFYELHTSKKDREGRFKAYIVFDEKPKVYIKEFDENLKTWNNAKLD